MLVLDALSFTFTTFAKPFGGFDGGIDLFKELLAQSIVHLTTENFTDSLKSTCLIKEHDSIVKIWMAKIRKYMVICQFFIYYTEFKISNGKYMEILKQVFAIYKFTWLAIS